MKKQLKYQEVYEKVKKEITWGLYKYGEKIPSIREQEKEKGVSRTTIEKAYELLVYEGYLESRAGKGHYVVTNQQKYLIEQEEKEEKREEKERKEEEIQYSFSKKCVDKKNLELKIWKKLIKEVCNEKDLLIRYSKIEGEEKLRKSIVKMMEEEYGIEVKSKEIMVGAGTQQLLQLIFPLVKGKITKIGMEEEKYEFIEEICKFYGIEVVTYKVKGGKVPVEKLKEKGCNSIFINGGDVGKEGRSLSVDEKRKIILWTKEEKGLLLEEDDSNVLQEEKPKPIQQIGRGENQFYLYSFSKTLIPSVRIAFMMVPQWFRTEVKQRKGLNQTASTLEQLALEKYIQEGTYRKQIKKLRRLYGKKRQKMEESIKKYFPKGMEYQENKGQMMIEIKGLKGEDLRKKGVECIGLKEGIGLCYRGISLEEIEQGVKIIGEEYQQKRKININ